MKCQENKFERRGGLQSHMYDQVMMLKNTAKEFNENHKDTLTKLRQNKFHCPMGWIRAQMGVSDVSLLVTEGGGDEGYGLARLGG